MYASSRRKSSNLVDAVWTHNLREAHYSIYCNLLDDSCNKLLKELRRDDIVLFLSGIAEPSIVYGNKETAHLVNIEGTQKFLQGVLKRRARLIFFSSVEVFDGSSAPNTEKTKVQPLNLYGNMKAKNEEFILKNFPPGTACIVRTPWIVNPILDSRCVIKQTLFGLKSREMKFATDYEISLVSANRVLENIETLITHLLFNLPQIIHFVSEGFISRYNLAVDVANILYPGKQIKVKATTFQELRLPESRARDSRVATVISWEPPFSKPDRLEDIVKEKSRLLFDQGVLNA